MLFNAKIEPRCAYCARGKAINATTVLCQKRGISQPELSCSAFRYAPLKRIPQRPLSLDISRIDDSDFQL